MHGPGPGSIDSSYQTPTWYTYPVIPVLDTVARSMTFPKRLRWRQKRDEALDRWSLPLDITFEIVEDHPRYYPILDPFGGDAVLGEPVEVPYLRLMTMSDRYGGSLTAVAETNSPRYGDEPGAYAALHLPSMKLYPREWQASIIAHEVGHCLGLDHRPQFEECSSVMQSVAEPLPDAHDLESLRWYYDNAP
jgi:hypothetical protein